MRCTYYVVRTAFGSSTGTWASGAGDSFVRAVCLATPSEPFDGSNPINRKIEIESKEIKEKVNKGVRCREVINGSAKKTDKVR